MVVFIFLAHPNIISFSFCLLGFLYLAYRRAYFREKIREKLLIPGTFLDDLMKHICCSCCAVCQEAREANESSLLVLDYCSGERIEMQEIAHDIATGRINSTLQTPTTDDGGTFWNHLRNISQTSKIILFLCAIVSVFSFIILFVTKKEKNLIVLCLTFLQPILILYFVYWRSRRQYATLDMVIKLFAVGFWLTTFQSIILEEILQTLMMILLGPFIATSLFNDDDASGTSNSPSSTNSLGHSFSPKLDKILKIFNILYTQYLNSTDENITGEYNYQTMEVAQSPTPETIEEEDDNAIRQKMKSHLWLVIIVVFLMAFVVAAGVEETMKHFSVRCCRFPAPLTDPHTILVYLMSSGIRDIDFFDIF